MKNIFDRLAAAIKESGSRVILIGGFAVNYYGVGRHTADVDFLISEKDYLHVLGFLKKHGYRETIRENLFARLSDSAAGLDIDFLFADVDTLDGIWKVGRRIKIAGHSFLTPSLLHLIALKVHSWKQDPTGRGHRDFYDIVELVKKNKVRVATKQFREIFRRYGTKEFYDQIIRASGTK